MNYKNLIFIVLLATAAIFTSCKKEESTINGQVTYTGAVSGIEYYADNASVYLYLGQIFDEYTTNDCTFHTTTDANGNFQFPNLWGADWQIYATITVNGYTYTGTSQIVSVDGENDQSVNLKLEAQ